MDAAAGADAGPRFLDAPQETWVVFEPVVEPVVLGFEADQHAGRLTVTRDDDLLFFGLAQKMREIVFDLGQRDFLHSGLPNRVSHVSASDFATIAKTSTTSSDTS